MLGASEPLGLLERQDGLVDVGGLGGRAGLIEVVPLVVQRLGGGAVLVGQDERPARPPCLIALYLDLLRPASEVGPRAWLALSLLIRLRSSKERVMASPRGSHSSRRPTWARHEVLSWPAAGLSSDSSSGGHCRPSSHDETTRPAQAMTVGDRVAGVACDKHGRGAPGLRPATPAIPPVHTRSRRFSLDMGVRPGSNACPARSRATRPTPIREIPAQSPRCATRSGGRASRPFGGLAGARTQGDLVLS